MTKEFLKLQNSIKENKIELKLKKSIKDNFGVWIYWFSETKKPKIFWKIIFVFYWLFSGDWFWIPLSIILAIKINLFYLLGILMPFLITRLLKPVGQGFIIYDAQNDEVLFDDLWANKAIGIMSVAKHDSVIHKDGVPDMIIDPYNRDWRKEINKLL
ncbi:MAG: hypothetical protein Q8L01_01880 [Candidatus Woesebacteria bacterium]|nr:hypothetical protein [Candidatus Woesebacteria bacterium]